MTGNGILEQMVWYRGNGGNFFRIAVRLSARRPWFHWNDFWEGYQRCIQC